MGKGYYANGVERIHRGGAELREDWCEGEKPRSSDIIEACRLAKVQMERFDHNDPSSLQEKLEERQNGQRTLIIVEGIYSMDGDICPLPEIIELKKKYGAPLMIDEAHSFGVLGTAGRGVESHFSLKTDDVDIWMGSLSKAVPSNGGFIAGKKDFIIYYINFSCVTSPYSHIHSFFIFSIYHN